MTLQEQILDDEDVMLSVPSEKWDRANDLEGHDEFDPELTQPVIRIIIIIIIFIYTTQIQLNAYYNTWLINKKKKQL